MRKGTLQAPGQSLCRSLKVPLILLQRGKEMQKCAHGCESISGELQLELCLRQLSADQDLCTLSLCHFVFLSLAHATLYCPPTVCSELPQGPYQGQAATSVKRKHTHKHAHTRSFHLCLSSDSVSQCLGRKIGLCRAQRFESPKAAHQIQLLQALMPRFASHRSSHFKLHSLSPTSQLWTDGFLASSMVS